MNKFDKIIGNSTLLSLCTVVGLFVSPVVGQNAYVQHQQCTQCRSVPRANGAVVCTPNTQNWGFYSPTWRVWPNERRPDVTFPQAIGAERIPTPAGVRPENVPVVNNATPDTPENDSNQTTNLPAVNFDDGKQPFEPQETLPPTEPVTDASATQTPAPETPVPETPAPVQETPVTPVIETPAEPASETPDTPDFKGLQPIVDPSMTTIENGTNSSAALPVLPIQESTSSDSLTVPPLSQIPTPSDNATEKDIKNSFRARQNPEQIQVPVEPAVGNSVDPQSTTTTDKVTPIESTYNANNPLRPSSAIMTNIPAMTNDMEPVALEGYSLVDLVNSEKWTQGKKEYSVIFEGRTYYCSDAAQKDEFIANPEKFTPVCRGFDPILKLNEDKNVDGKVDFCVVYKKKLYVFSSAETMNQFRENAKQYSNQIAKLENY